MNQDMDLRHAALPVTDDDLSLLDLVVAVAERWKLLLAGPLAAGLLAIGASFLVAPTYTARTTLLPPQQQQSAAAAALSQLGSLAGLAGNMVGLRSPAEQFVALMQSVTTSDRLIERFGLIAHYDVARLSEARKELAENVRVAIGKKDGLISVEVDDTDAQRAADMANAFVEELRRMTNTLALTEAQQRRVFFETHLSATRDRLVAAQNALQASGFSAGALKTDARVAAEGYARLRAEATAAEVRLQSLRRNLADSTPEVAQAGSVVAALREQLARLERVSDQPGGADYVGKFREFKYQETLFELFARQYELARLDESRDGALIQVVDVAKPADRRSRPARLLLGLGAAGATFVLLLVFVTVGHAWRQAGRQPDVAVKLARLRAAFSRR